MKQSKCQQFLQIYCQMMLRNCIITMREDIHKTIAAIVSSLFHNPPTTHVILAPECGGSHRIRLFCKQQRSRATNYCWPDLAVIHNGEARLIVEIEDAGICSPGRISSKVIPISVSDCLLNEDFGYQTVSISRATMLIQMVNTAFFQTATQKLSQYSNFEASVRTLLPLGCISHYF